MNDIESKLEKSKLFTKNLKANLVSFISPSQVSVKAKIPYKVLEIRETLLYRATDLAEAACTLFETENLVSAACVTRAFQETLAAIFYINRKVGKTLENKNTDHLDEKLMKALIGTKNNPNLPDPTNIITMINHVNKDIPGFRDIYDDLSELSHPNWAGTLGTYSRINKENKSTNFGRNLRLKESTKRKGIIALFAGLELIAYIYDEFAEMLPDLVKICEKELKPNIST